MSFTASTLLPPSNLMTSGATTTTEVSVSWSTVMDATGYYVSYQRQDLGTPPVGTPQYERILGEATSVTLTGLEPGTTYRIRVWSTDGASVSSEAGMMDVKTVESGKCEICYENVYKVAIDLTAIVRLLLVYLGHLFT